LKNYSETLDWLFTRLPMFQRQGGAAYKADLSRTNALCDYLGNPEKGLRCIHIAGTNGKGSLSHMWAAILQEHGYKTGLFTSPHLKDFRERIRINGEPISEEFVVNWVEEHKIFLEQVGMSFFEMNVGMALDAFRREEVDIAILEVGMGGRLDSTNVVTPELSIISNISFDHMQYLGDTLEKIAGEKAGIIKEGIPVVIGEALAETRPVFVEKAKKKSAPLLFAEEKKIDTLPECDLKGIYQHKNLRTLMASVNMAPQLNLQKELILSALKKVRYLTGLRGRWDILSELPLIIADTGHNEAGVKMILEQLVGLEKERWHFVWGMVNDKKLDGVLSMLPKNGVYYFCRPDVPRGLDGKDLAREAIAYGLQGNVYSSVNEAFKAAQENQKEDEGIFIGGSTFVVAEVL
jgi:dihydrofolate synthase/folylpolyglutamate synthase